MQKIRVSTSRREQMVDITDQVQRSVEESQLSSGLCVLYCPHTTAAITVNEGADPDVASDIISGLGRLIPSSWEFAHHEGNSDAHMKASLVGPTQVLIVESGRPVLGTWQRIFFCEFDGPRDRFVFIKMMNGGSGAS
jgi:secondary thiamine-phosphate synthase enzyme